MITPDQIEVPEGMLNAAISIGRMYAPRGVFTDADVRKLRGEMLAVCLAWLANNPIVPTEEQREALVHLWATSISGTGLGLFVAVDWQRRMFLKKEPELPEEVKGLLWPSGDAAPLTSTKTIHNEQIRKAYELGLKNAGSK